MRFIHFIAITAFVVAILAQPLKAAWWYVAAKPGMEVIGRIWVAPGSPVEVLVSTNDLCLKLDEATELIPADMNQIITAKTGQTIMDGKSVPAVTISLSKEKIKAGFAKQKYRFSLTNKKFEAKQATSMETQ